VRRHLRVEDPSEELAAELMAFAKTKLAPYKYPRWIEFVA
jgi:acyl-coenzyme A synthetase/AMP-(fatty) acid ligase